MHANCTYVATWRKPHADSNTVFMLEERINSIIMAATASQTLLEKISGCVQNVSGSQSYAESNRSNCSFPGVHHEEVRRLDSGNHLPLGNTERLSDESIHSDSFCLPDR